MIPFISSAMTAIANFIGNTNWTARNIIHEVCKMDIEDKLKKDYYIILTRRDNHLSTYAINIAHLFLTGKLGYYSHALMNLEDDVKSPDDFRLVEATGAGVHYSTFEYVFGTVSSVCLLKPKSMSIEHWTEVMDAAKANLGKPYDTLFDLKTENALSCVELVRNALRAEPNYATNFANFEKMIAKNKNLDPHMFYRCPDFEIVYEVHHDKVITK